jgi:hypothetical protein
MSPERGFGEISTRSVKQLCEATRKDQAFLDTVVKALRSDIVGFVKKTFTLTAAQVQNLEKKFDHPETTDITIRFVEALAMKQPNVRVTWKKCEPYPDPGQPEYADCCGVCVEWECRRAVTT